MRWIVVAIVAATCVASSAQGLYDDPNYVAPINVTIKNGTKGFKVGVGATVTLSATVTGNNSKQPTVPGVNWSSSNKRVATVDENGVVTGVGIGSVTITAATKDSKVSSFIYDQCTVTVFRQVEDFVPQVHYGSTAQDIPYDGLYRLYAPIGEQFRISPRFLPADATPQTIYYSMSPEFSTVTNATIESKEENGEFIFTATSAGYAQLNIALNTPDAVRHMEKPVQIQAFEPTKVEYISIAKADPYTPIYNYGAIKGQPGTECRLSINYNYDAGDKRVKWTSSNPDVATIAETDGGASADGFIIPIYESTLKFGSRGTAELTAEAVDGSGVSVTFTVNVTEDRPVVKVPVKQNVCPSIGASQSVEVTRDWWFFLHDDGTATLTYPEADDTSVGFPENPYEFEYPGTDAYRQNGQYPRVWNYIVGRYVVDEGLYYSALKMPESIVYGGKTYKVTAIDSYAFAGSNVQYINVPSTVTYIGSYAFKDAVDFKGLATVSNFRVVPNSVTTLGKGVFSGCKGLRRMVIGTGVQTIPEETFDNCPSLYRLEIGSGVKRIDCDISVSGANSFMVMNPTVPPVMGAGHTISFTGHDGTSESVYIKNASYAAYKAAFPDLYFRIMGLIVTPSQKTMYVNSTRVVDCTLTLPQSSAVCEYLTLYPMVNSIGQETLGWTHSSSSSRGIWYQMEFDDITAVRDASNVTSTNSVYLSFKKSGTQSVVFRPFNALEYTSSVDFNIIPGQEVTGVSVESDVEFMKPGDSTKLRAIVKPTDATNPSVAWKTSEEGIVEIDAEGNLTAIAPGTVSVWAVTTDPYSYKYESRPVTIEVQLAVESVQLLVDDRVAPASGISGYPGEKFALDAQFNPSRAVPTSCEWTTAGTTAAISGEGKAVTLELKNPGRALANFTVRQNVGEPEITVGLPILVKVPVTEITLEADGNKIVPSGSITGDIGTEITVKASVNANAADKGLAWTSSNPSVVEVVQTDDGCTLILKAKGLAVIMVWSTDGQGAEMEFVVNSHDPKAPEVAVTGIKLFMGGNEIGAAGLSDYAGAKFDIQAVLTPGDATPAECSWSIGDATIASLEMSDTRVSITLLAPGETVATFIVKQNVGSPEMKIELPIKVLTPVSEISVTTADGKDATSGVEGKPGDEIRLIASVNEDASDSRLEWSISDSSVATVELTADGCIIRLIGEGSAIITVKSADGKSPAVEIVVTSVTPKEPLPEVPEEPESPDNPDNPDNPDVPDTPTEPDEPDDIKVESIDINVSSHEGNPGDHLTLIVVVLPDNAADKSIIWVSSDNTVATVCADGEVTLVGVGEAIITGVAADGSGVKVECRIKVVAPQSAIGDVDAGSFKVSAENGMLIVGGLADGDLVRVFTSSGSLVATGRASAGRVGIALPTHGVYIAVTPRGSFKLRY